MIGEKRKAEPRKSAREGRKREKAGGIILVGKKLKRAGRNFRPDRRPSAASVALVPTSAIIKDAPAGPAGKGCSAAKQSTCREGFGTCYKLCPTRNQRDSHRLARQMRARQLLADPDNEVQAHIMVVAARIYWPEEGRQALRWRCRGRTHDRCPAVRASIDGVNHVNTSHPMPPAPRSSITRGDIEGRHATAFANDRASVISQRVGRRVRGLAVVVVAARFILAQMQNHPT